MTMTGGSAEIVDARIPSTLPHLMQATTAFFDEIADPVLDHITINASVGKCHNERRQPPP